MNAPSDGKATSGSRARISVALGTYNGERYLPAQLASIVAQTRLPDELVAADDGSTDATVALLQEFARTAPFPVRVMQNQRNLGSTRNFEQLCSLCTGDLIALSDQDDVWYPQRLERSEQALETHPEAGLVFSNADLIDEAGNPLDGSLWHFSGFTGSTQQALRDGDDTLPVRMRFVTGATVMFRARLRSCFPAEPGWIHDEWLAAAVPLYADLLPLGDRLIQYRRHAAQQVGPAMHHGPWQRLRQRAGMLLDADLAEAAHWQPLAQTARLTLAVCDRFSGEPLAAPGAARLKAYSEYARFQQGRSFFSANRLERVLPVLKHWSAYSKYYRHGGLGSILRDLSFARRTRP